MEKEFQHQSHMQKYKVLTNAKEAVNLKMALHIHVNVTAMMKYKNLFLHSPQQSCLVSCYWAE